MITRPQLPPKAGYVEVELCGDRVYRNVETGRFFAADMSPLYLSLDAIKLSRAADTQTAYAAYLSDNPIEYSGKLYAVSELVVNVLAQTMALLQVVQDTTVDWYAVDHECVVLTIPEFMTLAVQIGQRYKAAKKRLTEILYAIETATTAEEVQDIVIDYAALG